MCLIIFIGLVALVAIFGDSSSTSDSSSQTNTEQSVDKETASTETEEAKTDEKAAKEQAKLDKKLEELRLKANSDNKELINKVIATLEERENNYDNAELTAMGDAKVLNVFITIKTAWDDASIFASAGMDQEKILKELKKQNVTDQELNEVQFFVSTTVLDKYNNESLERIYTVSYNYPEAYKVNQEKAMYQTYLRFADFHANQPIGRKVLQAWCLDNDFNQTQSGGFCLK